MNAEIINIGDELLIGQVVNTNASWIAEQLNLEGIDITQVTIIPDNHEEIIRLLNESGKRSNLIIMTGGLGPTTDDKTKQALCEFFESSLVMNHDVLRNITAIFSARGYDMTPVNKQQAMVPDKARVLNNPYGTAPGLWFEKQNKIYVVMPGVPYEMQHLVTNELIPGIKNLKGKLHIFHKTILTQGVGESFLSDIISSWETELPPQIRLAYLPSPGMVRIRLTAKGPNGQELKKLLEQETEKLKQLIPQHIWGYDLDTLEEVTGKMLLEKNQTVSTAESCTGGYVAHHITRVPGSSSWYKGSIVAYSNEIKQKLLNVKPSSLQQHGAVSRQVVEEMAVNARKILNTDYSVSVSGIAGPEGGTPQKPVGTVWIAVAGKDKVESRRFLFGDNRERNVLRSVMSALSMLREFIIKNNPG